MNAVWLQFCMYFNNGLSSNIPRKRDELLRDCDDWNLHSDMIQTDVLEIISEVSNLKLKFNIHHSLSPFALLLVTLVISPNNIDSKPLASIEILQQVIVQSFILQTSRDQLLEKDRPCVSHGHSQQSHCISVGNCQYGCNQWVVQFVSVGEVRSNDQIKRVVLDDCRCFGCSRSPKIFFH